MMRFLRCEFLSSSLEIPFQPFTPPHHPHSHLEPTILPPIAFLKTPDLFYIMPEIQLQMTALIPPLSAFEDGAALSSLGCILILQGFRSSLLATPGSIGDRKSIRISGEFTLGIGSVETTPRGKDGRASVLTKLMAQEATKKEPGSLSLQSSSSSYSIVTPTK